MKVNRAAFLYLDPVRPAANFAQCVRCRDWVRGDRKCVIHGPTVNVPGTASCGFFVDGPTQPPGTKTHAWVTPEESGLVNRDVRCENCKYYENEDNESECGLFRMLNGWHHDMFELDEKVDKHGCCNAQTPGGDHG
jgi:hypothetical protein